MLFVRFVNYSFIYSGRKTVNAGNRRRVVYRYIGWSRSGARSRYWRQRANRLYYHGYVVSIIKRYNRCKSNAVLVADIFRWQRRQRFLLEYYGQPSRNKSQRGNRPGVCVRIRIDDQMLQIQNESEQFA